MSIAFLENVYQNKDIGTSKKKIASLKFNKFEI